MSLASIRQRTIVLMELRRSPPPPCSAPSFLLTLPFSPWHNCCIAADVISCFLLGISAVGPHLTFSPLLSDYIFFFAVEFISTLSHLILHLCISFTQLSWVSNSFSPFFTLVRSPHSVMFLLSSAPIYLFLCLLC